MSRRKVEIFSSGCPLCEQTIGLIQRVGANFCEIQILSVRDKHIAERAKALGLRSFPVVIVDGQLVPFDLFAALSQAFKESEWIRQFLNES